jgi:serine/threonine-protein kinase MRCK
MSGKMTGETRQKVLESLYLSGVKASKKECCSLETLLDILIVLYDECCLSTLRREKNIAEFIEYGKRISNSFAVLCMMIKNCLTDSI